MGRAVEWLLRTARGVGGAIATCRPPRQHVAKTSSPFVSCRRAWPARSLTPSGLRRLGCLGGGRIVGGGGGRRGHLSGELGRPQLALQALGEDLVSVQSTGRLQSTGRVQNTGRVQSTGGRLLPLHRGRLPLGELLLHWLVARLHLLLHLHLLPHLLLLLHLLPHLLLLLLHLLLLHLLLL